jgi:hypothetical protein
MTNAVMKQYDVTADVKGIVVVVKCSSFNYCCKFTVKKTAACDSFRLCEYECLSAVHIAIANFLLEI